MGFDTWESRLVGHVQTVSKLHNMKCVNREAIAPRSSSEWYALSSITLKRPQRRTHRWVSRSHVTQSYVLAMCRVGGQSPFYHLPEAVSLGECEEVTDGIHCNQSLYSTSTDGTRWSQPNDLAWWKLIALKHLQRRTTVETETYI